MSEPELTPFGLKLDHIKDTLIKDNLHKPRLQVHAHNYWADSFLMLIDPALVNVNDATLRVERLNGEGDKILIQLPKVNSRGYDQEFVERSQLTDWKARKERHTYV